MLYNIFYAVGLIYSTHPMAVWISVNFPYNDNINTIISYFPVNFFNNNDY